MIGRQEWNQEDLFVAEPLRELIPDDTAGLGNKGYVMPVQNAVLGGLWVLALVRHWIADKVRYCGTRGI